MTVAQIEFDAYDAANPQIWRAFERAALRAWGQRVLRAEAKATFPRYGAKRIMESLRYDTTIRAEGDSFKLNNTWTAFYARKFLARHSECAGLFQTRGRGVEPERARLASLGVLFDVATGGR